jgi:hypothetical protein
MMVTSDVEEGLPRFAELLREAHGLEAEPWHRRLGRELCAGGWPDRCSLPPDWERGPLIDLAVEAFASDPGRFPRRVIVVHRKAPVIDALQEHASRLAERLRHPAGPATAALAASLREATGAGPDDPPLRVASIPDSPAIDIAWTVRTSDAVVLIASLEQVGSALLFRSTAGSPRTAPVHAGLVGADSLMLLLDSEPDAPIHRTVVDLRDLPARPSRPMSTVRIDASPIAIEGLREFRPSNTDATGSRSGPVPGGLECRLVELDPGSDPVDAGKSRAAAFTESVGQLLDRGARRIGVFPRSTHGVRDRSTIVEALSSLARTIDAVSPRTPIDRLRLRTRLQTPSGDDADGVPVVVVADDVLASPPVPLFDAVVLEFDEADRVIRRLATTRRAGDDHPTALVFRFEARRGRGRPPKPNPEDANELDRWRSLERVAADPLPSDRTDSGGSEDPLARLWKAWSADLPVPVRPSGPRLLPSHLELLERTSPTPNPDPQALRFVVSSPEDSVLWCWRSDLPSPQASVRQIERYLELLPPTGAECRRVPRFLLSRRGDDATEHPLTPRGVASGDGMPSRFWHRDSTLVHIAPWRGRSGMLRASGDVRAGDVVLAGPKRSSAIAAIARLDVASWAWWLDFGAIRLRSNPPSTIETPVGFDCGNMVPAGRRTPEVEVWIDVLLDHCAALDASCPVPGFLEACEALRRGWIPFRVRPHPIEGWIVESPTRSPCSALLALDEDDSPGPKLPEARPRRIADLVVAEAKLLDLPPSVIEELLQAARWLSARHADPSTPERPRREPDLTAMPTSRRTPSPEDSIRNDHLDPHPGSRQERFAGVRNDEKHPGTGKADELARHLIATRWGGSRPLPSLHLVASRRTSGQVGASPADTPDHDGPGRLRRLSHRFGPWGLALLETVLRTSDSPAHGSAISWPLNGHDT